MTPPAIRAYLLTQPDGSVGCRILLATSHDTHKHASPGAGAPGHSLLREDSPTSIFASFDNDEGDATRASSASVEEHAPVQMTAAMFGQPQEQHQHQQAMSVMSTTESWTSLDSEALICTAGEYADATIQARRDQLRALCDSLLLDRARSSEPVFATAISTSRSELGDGRLPYGSARAVRVPTEGRRPVAPYEPRLAMGRVVERYLRQRQDRAALFREAQYCKKVPAGWRISTFKNCERRYETPCGPAPGWAKQWAR